MLTQIKQLIQAAEQAWYACPQAVLSETYKRPEEKLKYLIYLVQGAVQYLFLPRYFRTLLCIENDERNTFPAGQSRKERDERLHRKACFTLAT